MSDYTVAPPALLFDWALPLMPSPSTAPRQGTRGALLALGSALANADEALLAKRGSHAVQTLLSSLEHASPTLVPCTLWALHQIVTVRPSLVTGTFRDVVDLVLGWCLDPALPVEARCVHTCGALEKWLLKGVCVLPCYAVC